MPELYNDPTGYFRPADAADILNTVAVLMGIGSPGGAGPVSPPPAGSAPPPSALGPTAVDQGFDPGPPPADMPGPPPAATPGQQGGLPSAPAAPAPAPPVGIPGFGIMGGKPQNYGGSSQATGPPTTTSGQQISEAPTKTSEEGYYNESQSPFANTVSLSQTNPQAAALIETAFMGLLNSPLSPLPTPVKAPMKMMTWMAKKGQEAKTMNDMIAELMAQQAYSGFINEEDLAAREAEILGQLSPTEQGMAVFGPQFDLDPGLMAALGFGTGAGLGDSLGPGIGHDPIGGFGSGPGW